MSSDVLVAIFTGLTVLAVLAGGAVMMYLLSRPKVSILSLTPIHWFYIFEGGGLVIGTRITVDIKLLNNGRERTSISAVFETSNGSSFYTDERILLEGHGTTLKTVICLDSPSKVIHGSKLEGILILEPWHNRRLCIGHRQLKRQIEVFEDENNRGRD